MQRLSMRKIREALRLRADGLSGRQVAQSLSLGRATVSEYFRRADVAGLACPLPDDLSDIDLEQRLFPHQHGASARAIPQPDWSYALSDEAVLARCSENPYWQHFCGETFFQHRLPIDPSSLTGWRQRIGEGGV